MAEQPLRGRHGAEPVSKSLKAQRERVARELISDARNAAESRELFKDGTPSYWLIGLRALQRAAIVATARELGYEIDEDGKCTMAATAKMQPDPIALLDGEQG